MTANECLDKHLTPGQMDVDFSEVIDAMIDFAKHHVLAAQEAASVRNRMKVTSGWGRYNNKSTSEIHYTGQPINHDFPGYGDCTYEIIEPDRAVAFEAYPLENIK